MTGQVILRQAPRPVEVLAYVDGVVEEVFAEEGVRVAARGAYIQGIFGVGGECWGALHLAVDAPDATAESLGPEVAGKIVVVGSLISAETVEQARQAGAVGLIGGGLRDSDLRDLLGRDLGVAITGTEQIGLTVVATEGFGRVAMARKTFDILQACAGMDASMAGATQIRAGVLRPEIIVPTAADKEEEEVRTGRGRVAGGRFVAGDSDALFWANWARQRLADRVVRGGVWGAGAGIGRGV